MGKDIPPRFEDGSDEPPIAYTVGELRDFLAELPANMPAMIDGAGVLLAATGETRDGGKTWRDVLELRQEDDCDHGFDTERFGGSYSEPLADPDAEGATP